MRLLFMAISVLFLASSEYVQPPTPRFLELGEIRGAPVAYERFCMRINECAAYTEAMVTLTRKMFRLLSEVNEEVNTRVVYVSDKENYQIQEYHTYPLLNTGDCEDYALEKRRVLVSRGVPRGSLFIAYVVRGPKSKTLHAVLVVRTNKGDFVLDNTSKSVLHWTKLTYEWKSQETNNPLVWRVVTNSLYTHKIEERSS